MSKVPEPLPMDFSEFMVAFEDKLQLAYRVGPNLEGILEVDGIGQAVSIKWPATGAHKRTDFVRFQNLNFDVVRSEDGAENWLMLRLDAKPRPESALAFASAIVSQLAGGSNFIETVKNSIDATKMLLKELEVLSDGRAVGLLGELMVVLHLAEANGIDWAIESWLGPPRGEHDFSLPDCELEVKTTTSERRVHRISSGTQMVRSHNRSLYLVSIQLTETVLSNRGFTLPGMIQRLRDLEPSNGNLLENHLYDAGWRDWFSGILNSKYMYRAEPLAFLVDESFPAITPDLILQSVDRGELVESVSYSIDVGGLSSSVDPTVLRGFGGNEN